MVDDKENKRDHPMQAWEIFLAEQEKKFGKESVRKWLRSLKVLRFDAANLYLEAEDSFQLNWFEEHIRPLLSSLKNSNDRVIRVHLSTWQKKEEKKKPKFFSSAFRIAPDFLDPEMSLENFMPFSGNELAFKLIEQTLNASSLSFNPIFLYGNSATGKSHLLNAAALGFQKLGKKVFFVHAETFTDHVVGALRQGCMQEFRKAYRTCDVLILDDIHIFSRKNATQEEFFHTFNALHTMGNQILLSANTAPEHLFAIEPRLISRFEWGITIPMQDLAKGELFSILGEKSQLLGIHLTEEAKFFLLSALSYNLKKIHKALQALLLRNQHLPPKIDSALLKSTLPDLFEQETKNALNTDHIVRKVANFYGILPQDILGNSQARGHSFPRQIAMYFCRQKLKMPYMKIGDLFNRDHSTVMTSIKTIEQLQNKKEELSSALLEIAKGFL